MFVFTVTKALKAKKVCSLCRLCKYLYCLVYIRTQQMMSLNWDVCITGIDLEMKHPRRGQFKSIVPLFTKVYADLPAYKRLCLPSKSGPVRTSNSNIYLRQREEPCPPPSLFPLHSPDKPSLSAYYVPWMSRQSSQSLHSSWEDRQ